MSRKLLYARLSLQYRRLVGGGRGTEIEPSPQVMSQRLNRHGPWSTTAWRYEGIRPKGRPTDPAPILAEAPRTRLSERPKDRGPALLSSALRVVAFGDVLHLPGACPRRLACAAPPRGPPV